MRDNLPSHALARPFRAATMTATIGLTMGFLPAQRPAAFVVDESVAAMQLFLARPVRAHQYSAARRLEASGSGHRAWLDVDTEFAPASGLHYQVTAEGGSGYIRNKVLRALLEEERALIAADRVSSVALSADNYTFTPEGLTDDGLAIVHLRPLRKERPLIHGRMFLTPDGELRRVEGQLAKNPSFWVTRVQIARGYRRINGVLMPISLQTTAHLRWLGTATLKMSYRYSKIDNQVVEETIIE